MPEKAMTPNEGDTPESTQIVETEAVTVASVLLDVARLRDSGFKTAAERKTFTVPALVVAAAAILVSGVGGWLYLKFDDFGALPTGRVLFRELVVGSILTFVLWVAWLLIVEATLKRRGAEVDRLALLRAMGFACVPLVATLLMVVPMLAFGAGLVALALWVAATERAVAAAVPEALPADRRVANLAGFAVLAVVLGGIAFQTGMAPGPFVFAGVWELLR